ncbi:hypothetical protein F7Q99_39450 [Streptomyces kaniharaensis]|uniref:Uncharacterized protein n=1 Tax=Streptomyces kaniharaensis TaxID=212423 RepID=A0A6N7L466_9ACTN|nr:hypothetical protein [Streptomyces kaniharaensis]MQS18105.1 hypothetical protein [Streptomyces kaniharaensis]
MDPDDDAGRPAGDDDEQRNRPHQPGPEDRVMVALFGLIVLILILVGIFSNLDVDTGGPTQDWNTVWH